MTKKDYLKAVEVIKSALWVRSDQERLLLAETFVALFEPDNPKFNRQRFLDACLKS